MPPVPHGQNRSNTTNAFSMTIIRSGSKTMRMWWFCSGGRTTQNSIRTCRNRQTHAVDVTLPMIAQWRRLPMHCWLTIRVSWHRNQASSVSRKWDVRSTGTRRRRRRTRIDPRISTGFFGRARLLQKVIKYFWASWSTSAVRQDFDWHFNVGQIIESLWMTQWNDFNLYSHG